MMVVAIAAGTHLVLNRRRRWRIMPIGLHQNWAIGVEGKWGGCLGYTSHHHHLLLHHRPTAFNGATINDDNYDERRSGGRPRLGASDSTLGEDDYDDDVDSDEDYRQFLTEKEICAVNAISSQAALDAIGLIRRNIDNDGGEDEMDEKDMVNVVAKALYERGFQSAAAIMIEISVMEKEDDSNSDDGAAFGTAMTLSSGLVVIIQQSTQQGRRISQGGVTTGY